MLDSARPVAYIRRSVARRGDPGDVSREFQTGKVRALANGDGPALRVIDGDWGKSAATDKTDQRTAFLALLEDVERGAVSHLYAYSPDRLARSVEWSARLVNACRRAGVPITTTAGTVAPDDPAARAMFNMLAIMNETALDEMERKAKASAATIRERGQVTGGRAYGEVRTLRNGETRGDGEDPAAVLDAFREAGSYFGAARLLNERNVPSRSGRAWYPRTVQRIVNRQDPATARYGRRGAPSVSRLHRLAGLLRCHCGAVMGQTVSGEGTPRYRCPNGVADPSHSRPYIVPERALMPWIIEEADRFRVPGDAIELDKRNEAKRAGLAAKRDRIIDMAADGVIDKSERDRRLALVDADLGAIVDVPATVAVPGGIDWSWPPESINAVLRTYWYTVELGPDMRPVRADWRLPAEYVAST